MLGVAVRAAARARAKGRTVKVIYDAHEFFAGDVRENPTWGPVMAAQERKYISLADAVMSPIEGYADAMVEYHGIERFPNRKPPVLVRNMPALADLAAVGLDTPGVRGDLKLPPDVPLLVHPGSVTKVRGLEAVVRALPQLDGVHAALIVGKRDGYLAELSALASELGVAERFHLLDYVPSEELTGYLASATIGIDTLLHIPLHELTITTKFWSYISARLPMVVSDVKATAQLARELGNGEVYVAGDADGFAAAVRKVLADPGHYTAVYTEETLSRFSWEGQAETMLSLYESVTGLNPVAQDGEDRG
jgi:glycosyltransferase involved in cell wall biosynthesis